MSFFQTDGDFGEHTHGAVGLVQDVEDDAAAGVGVLVDLADDLDPPLQGGYDVM